MYGVNKRGFAMKKMICFLLIFLTLSLFACSDEAQKTNDTLAKVNNYTLSYDEFQRQLADELRYDTDVKLTKEVKKKFLDQLIQEQLLIQEAKKLKLDRKEKFVRAIERYWKSTLIKDLLELKGEELSKTILISQEEVRAYYEKLKKSGKPIPPFEEMEDKIVKKLKEKKKLEKLKKWMAGLRKKADIKINEKLLLEN